jgi:hypothetical protein
MSYKVAMEPGSPERPNEDFAGVLGNSMILLDGSGGPLELPTGCSHGVPWFVWQLGARCLGGMAAEQERSLSDILASAISEVSDLHVHACDLREPGTPASVIVMARIQDEAFEYLVLGDSTLAIQTGDNILPVSDRRIDQVVPAEFQAMLSLPAGTPERQAARIHFVRCQRLLRNQPGGYPIASTDPGAAYEALTGSVPVNGTSRAALLSDGVTRFTEFGLGTWEELLDMLADGGPEASFHRIRAAEDGDPDGVRWPRAKRHDDVSAVYWSA